MNAASFGVTRPINDWCADGTSPSAGICDDGTTRFGPQWAESWDDWGPSTPRCTRSTSGSTAPRSRCATRRAPVCGVPGSTTHTRGRLGAFQVQYITTTSTLEYVSANRNEMLYDEAERYRRGVRASPASTAASRRSTSTTTG